MKVVMMAQSKGGSGKTVTLIALASAAIAKGERVLVVDTDQVHGEGEAGSLTNWANMAQHMEFWHPNISILTASNIDEIFDGISEREKDIDLCLIDTSGGTDKAMIALATAVDLIVIPAMPDLDEIRRGAIMQKTLLQAGQEIEDKSSSIAPIVCTYNRTASSSKRSAETEAREAAIEFGLNFAESELRDRKSYRNMRDSGLLSVITQFLNDEGGLNIGQAKHFQIALDESTELLDEVTKHMRAQT